MVGVVRPFIGKGIRFSSIFPHLCRLIQHYQGTLFTFCQSDCRLAYKNNEFHGFRYIYTSSYGTFVVASNYNKGGTWAGATEAMNGGIPLKDYIEERAVSIANYIIDSNATVRQTVKAFGVSKSMVHTIVTK